MNKNKGTKFSFFSLSLQFKFQNFLSVHPNQTWHKTQPVSKFHLLIIHPPQTSSKDQKEKRKAKKTEQKSFI